MKSLSFLTFFLYAALISCHHSDTPLEKSLKQAGKNATELEAVIEHFKHDEVGKLATKFLIENMLDLNTYDLKTNKLQPDLNNIDSDYLIGQIERAISNLQFPPRKGGGTVDSIFLEYVLPYRLGSEKLVDWRTQCLLHYGSLNDSLSHFEDLPRRYLHAVRTINGNLVNHFKYSTSEWPAEFKTWSDLMISKKGDCWAMTNTITYPLRALGIPTTVDFVTCWGNSNGTSHAWNVIVLNNARTIPFLGFEASPPDYNPFRVYKNSYRSPGKVYRKTFSINRMMLKHASNDITDIPDHLLFDRAIDVTNEYVLTRNVLLRVKADALPNIAYLSSFTNGNWRPLSGTVRMAAGYKFDKMPENILYLPSSFTKQHGVKSIGDPFYINNGTIIFFKPILTSPENLIVSFTRSQLSDQLDMFGQNISKRRFYEHMEGIMKGFYRSIPQEGSSYKLFYWDDEWIFHSEVTKEPGQELVFTNVPRNALFRLISAKGSLRSRPFSFQGTQIWW